MGCTSSTPTVEEPVKVPDKDQSAVPVGKQVEVPDKVPDKDQSAVPVGKQVEKSALRFIVEQRRQGLYGKQTIIEIEEEDLPGAILIGLGLLPLSLLLAGVTTGIIIGSYGVVLTFAFITCQVPTVVDEMTYEFACALRKTLSPARLLFGFVGTEITKYTLGEK
jgi:hypothetical protein